MGKFPVNYNAYKIGTAQFISTYRGQIIFILEPRTMGRKATINTHGFHTKTTIRCLNLAFEECGLPWRASLKAGITTVQTEDNLHTLGDIEYVIFIN